MTAPTRRGILELLDYGSALSTPVFQRSFAWGRSQVDDFWKDLKRALDEPKGPSDYFLGLVVIDDTNQIQDGQQRLALTLLTAAAIYQATESAKESGAFIEQLALEVIASVSPALRQSPTAPLSISPQDQDALLNKAGVSSQLPESAKRLTAARKQVTDRLAEDLAGKSTPDSKLGRLKSWAEFLRSNAYVVTLQVPPQDAHNIFETLNTRGIRLSNGDLVKSHLIARASDGGVAVNKWNELTKSLMNPATDRFEDDLESFLLHYYGSKYARTTKADFFGDFRTSIEHADALDVLSQLIESAKIYSALVNPAAFAAYWAALGEGTQQAVELLNGLNLRQLRYLLLSVLRDFGSGLSKANRRKLQCHAVLRIAAWSVRGLVHGRTGGGEAERTYITAAKGIRDGTVNTVAGLRGVFVKRNLVVLDDSIFRDQFLAFQFDSAFSHIRARSVLYALEYHKISKKAGLVPKGTLTLEHVLPQSREAGTWATFTDDEMQTYAYRLGNLLLIDGPSGANNQLRNKEWPEKKKLIKSWGNQTPLSTEALKIGSWSKSAIDKRTQALASLAVAAWKA